MDDLTVERLDHVAVLVTDVDRARAFYGGVLGLPEVARPPSFDFPGAWFRAGPGVIHLLGQGTPDPRGRRHVCLWVRDVHAAARHLGAKGLSVAWDTKYKIGGVDRFFTDDPDGNRIEVQGSEQVASDRSVESLSSACSGRTEPRRSGSGSRPTP